MYMHLEPVLHHTLSVWVWRPGAGTVASSSLQISLKPRSGVLGQLVIFDFGTFYLARGLSIHVLNEGERKLVIDVGTPRRARPAKP